VRRLTGKLLIGAAEAAHAVAEATAFGIDAGDATRIDRHGRACNRAGARRS
jgi:hypothetical protein